MSLIATTERTERSPRASRGRRVWEWIAIVAAIVVAGSVFAAFQRSWNAPEPFEADSPRYDGARAIVTLLGDRGVDVITADTLADARETLTGSDTLVVTDASLLRPADLHDLATVPAQTVVLGGDYAALGGLFPGVGFGGHGTTAVGPGCADPVARNAGDTIPGTAYTAPGADGCYPVGDGYGLLSTNVDDDSTAVLLDGSATVVNEFLAQEGNAALALGLMGQHGDVVWYTPSPTDAAADTAPTLGDLVPPWVTPLVLLAALVAISCAVWRGRRFGPLVAETLPVTVRAGETLEGRARLYREARDPSHALATLQRGAAARMARRLGLPATAPPEDVARAASGVLNRDPRDVHAILTSPAADDADFAELGARLRELEDSLESADPWKGRSR